MYTGFYPKCPTQKRLVFETDFVICVYNGPIFSKYFFFGTELSNTHTHTPNRQTTKSKNNQIYWLTFFLDHVSNERASYYQPFFDFFQNRNAMVIFLTYCISHRLNPLFMVCFILTIGIAPKFTLLWYTFRLFSQHPRKRNAKESRVNLVAAGNQNNKPKKRRSFRNNAFHWDPNPPPTHLQVDHLWPKTEQKK